MRRIKVSRRGILLAGFAVVAVALLVAVVVRPPATAAAVQTPEGAFVTINPAAGFPLDPFIITLQGGGPVNANTLSKDCTGWVTKAPSVTVDYKGKSDMLKAFFYSDGDPVLVVQGPDGKFSCNDNTNPILRDPTVTVVKPAQGKYNVWVGAAAERDLIPGFLVFTGHADVNAGALALQNLVKRSGQPEVLPQDSRVKAAATRVAEAMAAKMAPAKLLADGKALTAQVTADGMLPAPEVVGEGPLCAGLINAAPSYAFDLSGKAKAVGMMFEGDGDATIVVRGPDGNFVCSDDADGGNLNPLLLIPNPAEGTYRVWVGRVSPGAPVTGTLTVASGADLKPAVLKKQQ